MHILIADDEAYICDRLVSVLSNMALPANSSIAVAHDGLNALQLALDQIPDLLICDIKMPGLNGLELAQQIQALNQNCALIILTHYSDPDYLRSAIALHVKAYFDKPICAESLTHTLEEIFCEFSQRKKQLESYNDALTGITELIKKLWCQELFKKEASFDFLVERCRQYHFEELISASYRCVLLRNASAQSLLPQWLPQGMHLLSRSNVEPGSLYCFLYADAAEGVSEEAVSQWFETLKKNGLADGMSAGNSVCGRQLAFGSFEHAQEAANQLFFSNSEQLLFWKPKTVCRRFAFSDHIIKTMRESLYELDFRSAQEQLQSLLSQLQDYPDTPTAEILAFFHKIVDMLLHVSVLNQLCFHEQHENTELYKSILLADRFSTLQSLMLGWFEELSSFGEGDTRVIRSVTACIRRNYTNPVFGNSDICAYTGYSMSYLCTLFKRCMGVTINYYITQIRMEHACRLLAGTDEPIEKIASAVGYTSAKHFSRSFKAHMLITPGQYRKQMEE